MNKRRVVIGIVAGVVIFGGVAFASGMFGAATQTSAADKPTATIAAVKASDKIVAEGKVVPVRSASLSLAAGGIVTESAVIEGQKVEAGQILLKLDSAKQDVAVSQAEAGVKRAQAHLDELKAGARPQEVASAKAAVDAAQAQLQKVQESARPEDVAAANAALAAAKSSLQKAQEGFDSDVIVAAQNDLAKLKAGPTAEDVKAAEIGVEQAKSALWAAQIDRDATKGLFGQDSAQGKAADARVSAAEQAVNSAENGLAKVKAGPRAEDISTAEARLAKLQKGTDAATIANAKAQVDAAQAKLDVLNAPARASEIAAAQAEVRRAQSNLDLLQAGSRPETIAAAEADLAAAKATHDQAKATKADTELRAPFAGTVASIDLKAGENAIAGTPVVKLADLSQWQIETTDLTELNVANVRENSPVTVKFDGIAGLELPGTVAQIKALGEKNQGDVVYTVVVKPQSQDERLRWNMTAAVTIDAAK